MDDFDQFERSLAAALRSDADMSVARFEPATIASAAVASTRRRRLRIAQGFSVRPRSNRWPIAAAIVMGVLMVGALLPAIVGRPSPTPSAAPNASLPAIVPPSSTPSAAAPNPSAFPRSSGVWIATGSMGTPRSGHTAVRLLDGRVLVAGARDENDTSAELYDPMTGTWSATGNMAKHHACFPATLLRDGKVLVGVVDDPDADDLTLGAEVYDPATGTWTSTGKMVIRSDCGLSATLLLDGKVLVAGREGSQLYNPESGTWAATGSMITPPNGFMGRAFGAAVLLPDGRVLVAGGGTDNQRFDTAELYDPGTGTWTATASMDTARDVIVATLLADGTVLVVGYPSYSPPTSAEVYDPASGTWTPTGDMVRPDGRYLWATPLLDGTVLASDPRSGQAELYDPSTRSWATTGSMLQPHNWSPATLLLDGTVLVAGGAECSPGASVCPDAATDSAELYIPAGVSPPSTLAPVPSPTPVPVPTPSPTPIPPQAGPVPPGAWSWKVMVRNKSDQPATLFVADENEQGLLGRMVGSVTPNVVPAGAFVEVTFLLPAKGVEGWSIFVNPGPKTGGLIGWADVPLAGGEIYITAGGQPAWRSLT